MAGDDLIKTTETYYDSEDADNFYFQIWGGEDIHVGLYQSEGEDILKASARTVGTMADRLAPKKDQKILDIGAGYGGAARHLAKKIGCEVTCLNLSEKENRRNLDKNEEQGLAYKIEVVKGNFENLPFDDEEFDHIWCEDAILHSDQKKKVFEELHRVLKSGGDFIFTDPMQSDDCPDGVLEPILKRIHLKEMGSVKKYKAFAAELGMEIVDIDEMPEQLVNHYSSVRQKLIDNYDDLVKVCSEDYLENMKNGLQHWIEGGKKGHLNWGILHFRKK